MAHVHSSFSVLAAPDPANWRACGICQRGLPGRAADKAGQIVPERLAQVIVPQVYAAARDLPAARVAAGHESIIVGSSGQEMVAPITALLGASQVIAPRMEVSAGRYTGSMKFYAYGEAKAVRMHERAAESGYQLTDCFA